MSIWTALPTLHCKNRSVLSTLICPNTHTKALSVCVFRQISVLNTLQILFLQCVDIDGLDSNVEYQFEVVAIAVVNGETIEGERS